MQLYYLPTVHSASYQTESYRIVHKTALIVQVDVTILFYCGKVKMIHKVFCLATLEHFMKEWPGGSYIVMKSTPIVPVDRPLMEIG